MKKRIISMILCIIMVLGMLPVTVFAADIFASGYCGGEGDGTNLTWELDSANRLTIKGNGAMTDFNSVDAPWNSADSFNGGIIIQEGVTSIGNNAFKYCAGSGLYGSPIELQLPETLTRIGDNAFFSSDISGEITIPKNVEYIGKNAFSGCQFVTYFNVESTIANLCSYDGCLYDTKKEMLVECPEMRSGILTIPKETSIIDKPVRNYYGGVDSEYGYGLQYNHALSEIVVEDGNTTYATFNGCLYNFQLTEIIKCPGKKNTSLTFPSSILTIGDYAFYKATGTMGELWLPESITRIGDYAFAYCRSFSNWLVIPDNVTYIGDCAFACQHPSYQSFPNTYIIIPSRVTYIGDYAFELEGDLQKVYMKGNAPELGDDAFGWSGDYGDLIIYCLSQYWYLYDKLGSDFSRDRYLLDIWGGTTPTNPPPEEPTDPDIPPVIPDNPDTPITYSKFGQYNGSTPNPVSDPSTGLSKYLMETVTIAGTTYNVADTCTQESLLLPTDYLGNYYYIAYNLNDSNEVSEAKIMPGIVCTLEGYDSATKVVDTDYEPIISVGEDRTLPSGSFYVSDVTASSFPTNEIGSWVGDQIRIYCVGEQIFKAIHVVEGSGTITNFDALSTPQVVYIDDIPFCVVDDTDLVETIRQGLFKETEYTLYDDTIIEVSIIPTIEPDIPDENKAIIIVPGITGSELYVDTNHGKEKVWIDVSFDSLPGTIAGLFGMLECDSGGKSIYSISAYENPNDGSVGSFGYYTELYNDLYDYYDERSGGTGEYTVDFFAYDWRLTNEKAASQLNEYINSKGYTDIVLVAHSMGGIVSSLYIDRFDINEHKVDKLITLGTPFYGSPKALSAFITGEFINIPTKLDNAIIKSLVPNLPGVYELLPTKRYFDKGNYYLEGYKNGDFGGLSGFNYNETRNFMYSFDNEWYNNTLFTQAETLHESLNDTYDKIRNKTIDAYTIVGFGTKTLSCLQQVSSLETAVGYPDPIKNLDINLLGDGTVPLISSTMNNTLSSDRLYYVNGVEHTGLVEDNRSINLVMNIIDGYGDTDRYSYGCGDIIYRGDELQEEIEGLFTGYKIIAACPVELTVKDSTGKFIGTVTSSYIDAIEGHYHDFYICGENNEIKIAFVDDASDIVITGIGDGYMNFIIERYLDGVAVDKIEYIDVPITDATTINTDTDISDDHKLEILNDNDHYNMYPDGSTETINPDDSTDDFNFDYWYWVLLNLYNQEFDITASATEGGTITPVGTSKVKYDKNITYTITPDEGYAIADVLVNGKSVGAVSEYTIKRIKKDQTIHAIFVKTAWENHYTDVSDEAWYYEDIEFVSENGLMIGTGNNLFSPSAIVNRAMLVTVLWRLEGSPVVDSPVDFYDVPTNEWYTAAVNWASANGIVNGYGNGEFGAMDNLTHEQIMAILNRYAVYKQWSENVNGNADDSYTNSEWAENNVLWAELNGIFDGIGSDISDLTEGANRAELAAYLRRFCERFVG